MIFNRNKLELYYAGIDRIVHFCQRNPSVPFPVVNLIPVKDWRVSACAYYRPDTPSNRKWTTTPGINICLDKCQTPCDDRPSRNWTWPGNTVDREPYGVLAHELGHHCDWHASERKGTYYGDCSILLRAQAGESPITTYCDGDHEWFAEMFRVFVTNPHLLSILRPKTYALLCAKWVPVAPDTHWRDAIGENAPPRVITALQNKIQGRPTSAQLVLRYPNGLKRSAAALEKKIRRARYRET